MKKLFFSKHYPMPCFSAFLLGMRLLFGILFFTHGLEKMMNFSELVHVFPDPLGVGSEISFAMILFAEFFCSIAFITGFLFRLAVIPMIIAMSVAFFEIHRGSVEQGELAFIYLTVFAMMAITGPGLYSIDRCIRNYCLGCNDDNSCSAKNG